MDTKKGMHLRGILSSSCAINGSDYGIASFDLLLPLASCCGLVGAAVCGNASLLGRRILCWAVFSLSNWFTCLTSRQGSSYYFRAVLRPRRRGGVRQRESARPKNSLLGRV